MLRFEKVLAEGFAARGIPVDVLRPKPVAVRCLREYRYSGFPKLLGYVDKFVFFPRTIRNRLRKAPPGAVCHIIDHSNAIYAPHFGLQPLVVTCHDLLQVRSALGEFPQNPLSRSGQKYQRWILDHLSKLRCAVCVSEKTRTDLLRLAGLPVEATHVIPNGLNYKYQPLPPTQAEPVLAKALSRQNLDWPGNGSARPRFLFSIGGAHWYKNRTGLVRIFGEIKRRLTPSCIFVYVGLPFDAEQERLIGELGLRDSLLRIPNLSNEELCAAYSLAEGLVFPSWEEGFGWPIAEAQACGCPVFTSNRAPMTEVGGDAARYFDPSDPAGAAEVVINGLALPAALRSAGILRARHWDAQLMLDAYLKLYDSLRAPLALSPPTP